MSVTQSGRERDARDVARCALAMQAEIGVSICVKGAHAVSPSFSLQWVLPEYGVHAIIVLVLLFGMQWGGLILNLPLLGYHAWR